MDRLLPYAERVNTHIQNVYNTMQDVLLDSGLIGAAIRSSEESIEQTAIAAEIILNDIINMTSTPYGDGFAAEVDRTTALLTRSEQITGQVYTYLRYAQIQLSQAVNISQKYEQIGENSNELTSQITSLQNNFSAISNTFNSVTAKLPQLIADVATVNYVIAFANSTIENTDSELNNLQISLMRIQNQIQDLRMWLGEAVENDDMSGSGSGLGSGFESGMESGDEEIEPFVPEDDATATIQMSVALLGERVVDVREEVEECAVVLQQAEDHVTSLREEAREINE